MMQEGRRIYERTEEKNREDMIQHFNKSVGMFTPGLSEKKIVTFITGVSGRQGGPEDWEKYWQRSARRHGKVKRRESKKAVAGEELDVKKQTAKELDKASMKRGRRCRQDGQEKGGKDEWEAELVIEDRRELPLEERARRALQVISSRVSQVQQGSVEVVPCWRYAAEVVDDLRCRIARWETERTTTSVERVREVVRLHSGDSSTRRHWLRILEERQIPPEMLLEVVEGIVYGKTCVVVDEALLEKTVLRCLAQEQALQEVGVGLFRLAVVCGERCMPISFTEKQADDDETYELAEGALRLQREIVTAATAAEPHRRDADADADADADVNVDVDVDADTPLFPFPVFTGERAVRVGVQVCEVLSGLRNGELMLWASHVVVAHSRT